MIELIDILLFALLIAGIFQFWRLSKQAETADNYAKAYCEKQGLQFISCARISSKVIFFKRDFISWQGKYEFEFSGNGEDCNKGWLIVDNLSLTNVTTEVYRM